MPNNATPLISVIVPVYNAEDYLRYCIDSILQQSYTNLEVILVDDGPKDSARPSAMSIRRRTAASP